MERAPRDDGGAVRLPRLPCVGRRVRVALGALCDCVLRRRHAHLCDRTDDAAARPRGAPRGRLGRHVPPERQLRALRLARLHAAAVGRRHRRVRPADARARGAGARGGGVARRPERRVCGRGPHRVAVAPGVGARRAHAAPPLGPRHPRRVLQLGTPHILRRRQRGLHLGHAQRRQRRCRPPPRRCHRARRARRLSRSHPPMQAAAPRRSSHSRRRSRSRPPPSIRSSQCSSRAARTSAARPSRGNRAERRARARSRNRTATIFYSDVHTARTYSGAHSRHVDWHRRAARGERLVELGGLRRRLLRPQEVRPGGHEKRLGS